VDVLHRILAPFLGLRDIRSLMGVSKYLHQLWSPLNLTLPDLRSYICSYRNCPNREYIHKNLDPFLVYDPMNYVQYGRCLVLNIIVGVWATPVYIFPICRVLCASWAPGGLDAAIDAYITIEGQVCTLTRTKSLVCTCACLLCTNVRSDGSCTHMGWPIQTIDVCLECVHSRSIQDPSAVLPMSFVGSLLGVSSIASGCFILVTSWWLSGLRVLLV
jgi:hypothetical protein